MMKIFRFGRECALGSPRSANDAERDVQERALHANISGQPHPQQYATVLARLLEAAESSLEGDPISARNYIGRALALLRPTTAQPWKEKDQAPLTKAPCARGGLAPWQIRQLVEYIDANCTENLRCADLAQVAKLSTSYFIRAFKASFGETPHAYVIGRRIMLAQAMMLETDDPLGLIAVACGFSDQAHFCRRFRLATGSRPQNWRGTRRSKSVHIERAHKTGAPSPQALAGTLVS